MNRGPESVNHKAKLVGTRSVGADFQYNVDGDGSNSSGAAAAVCALLLPAGRELSPVLCWWAMGLYGRHHAAHQ